ncbi:hypothetical protein AX15_000856 [Amanita polypyramis BW_CC]|nr:hypothetical protein AX15_000856 [Amanita polypyramis BW_CC]
MHFGPEWMRAKQHPAARVQIPSSPPSTYSSLVSMPSVPFEKRDDSNPFRYSKEEMLGIYKEGPIKGGLGLEVERWEGVVREVAAEPLGLREMSEAEKKLFSGSINSDLRRRQSGDYLSPLSISTDRSRLTYSNSMAGGALRERFGAMRRRDSADSPTSATPLPRKQSFSGLQNAGISPRDVGLPSPRNRVGLTSNFDGILSSSDSWSVRRRTSEASLKSAVTMSREASNDLQNEARAYEIREGKERDNFDNGVGKILDQGLEVQAAPQTDYEGTHNLALAETELPTDHSSINAVDYNKAGISRAPSGPPPGLQDLATVEWSYKDPTGQIQGPFRADLVQKWYDGGYFSLDLPMKRTYLDTHWTTVEDLLRRASSDKIFLSPPLPIAPPGLVRRTNSPLQPYLTSSEHNMYTALNQPSPIRSLRNSTLDSYIGPGSNPPDSPSSFSSARFSNGSPDSLGLGGRGANPSYIGETSANGRVANLANIAEVSASLVARRPAFSDTTLDSTLLRSQDYSNIMPNRVGEYTFDGVYNPGPYAPMLDSTLSSRSVDPIPPHAYSRNIGPEATLNYHNTPNGHDSDFHDSMLSDTIFSQSDYGSTNTGHRLLRPINDEPTSPFSQYNAFSSVVDNAVPDQSQYNQTSSPFPSHLNVQSKSGNTLNLLDQHPVGAIGSSDRQADSETSAWPGVTDTSAPQPFDGLHPPESNATSVPAPQVSPWSNKMEVSQQLSNLKDTSAWSYQTAVPDGWKDELQHDRLTFSNVVQHNQRYQSNDAQITETSVAEFPNPPEEQANAENTTPIENTPATSDDLAQLPRNRSTSRPDQEQAAFPDTSDKAETPMQVPISKVAWSREPGPSISLREIQEAEEKKAEVRRAAERAMRAASVPAESKEELHPFTTSWGLPSSQAGVRLPASSKETTQVPSPSTQAPPAPVWASAVKSNAKKSMKEIQEEEERRKRLSATKEPTVATVARKTPAESANKSPVNQGGAWTVIGHNGKATGPPAVSAKPSLTPTSSSMVSATPTPRTNGSAAAKPAVSAAASKAPSSTAPKVDDFPPTPSHDLLRWLTDSLKGLNNSVNVEEIMSMLLSFPLDPDPSTVELISDLIYANSTTLDGRRFAAEFVSKRKNDAVSRAKNTGSSSKSLAKPVSIADVVKAAPKPAQSEWTFKVVNKKKRGGRA